MSAIFDIKSKINRELYPISFRDVSNLVKNGKLPETKKHLEDFEINFKSLSAWTTAYYELSNMSAWDRCKLTNS